MLKSANININRDDQSINDFLICLDEFREIPNKICIFHIYETIKFKSYIDSISSLDRISREIIPDSDESIINEKHFVKISDFYLSYIEYNKTSELSQISDVVIYFKKYPDSDIESLILILDKFIVTYENVIVDQKFNVINLSTDGLYIDPIDILEADYDNIPYYFNRNTMKQADKLSKSIRKKNKGLSIIHGERGVGKTTLVNYILKNVDKLCIFIPTNMIDVLNNNDFKNFIRKNKNSIIIIDDCELYFTNAYSKSNILTNNILQMVDGFSSDMDNLHILLVLNTENIKNIDQNLLECNNMIDIIEVAELDEKTYEELCKYLNIKKKHDNTKLIDILGKRLNIDNNKKMGF